MNLVMTAPPPRSYLLTVARRVGCPIFWLDDCEQEMRIAIWKAPAAPWKTVVHRTAIDFVRVIHGRSEASQKGHDTVNIEGLPLGYEQDIDGYIDAKALLIEAERLCSPAQWKALRGTSEGLKPGKERDRWNSLRFQGRMKLRRLVA